MIKCDPLGGTRLCPCPSVIRQSPAATCQASLPRRSQAASVRLSRHRHVALVWGACLPSHQPVSFLCQSFFPLLDASPRYPHSRAGALIPTLSISRRRLLLHLSAALGSSNSPSRSDDCVRLNQPPTLLPRPSITHPAHLTRLNRRSKYRERPGKQALAAHLLSSVRIMASYSHQMPQRHASQQGYAAHPGGAAAAAVAPGHSHRPGGGGAPAGTFASGTKIQVGSHRVVIQKYLSEGGFAHVYLVKLPAPVEGTDLAVLKRVAVPDKESLRSMRTEVETMKRLKGHRPIVAYMDSHASELRGGGYEVFLLMEFCDGGGLIDFMNTRLQHRLTEPEILSIFADIAEGVACMHYLKPPLLHRDIKVENVLITTRSGGRRFMLCDFGSASAPRPAPTTVVECRLMDEDVQKHTTLQYRSPEMVDVYRKQPLNEKADIWALGVFLYKLCYYTTPFEDQGQLAILNASYRFPSHPNFSDKIKRLIGACKVTAVH